MEEKPKYPIREFIRDVWYFFKHHKGKFLFFSFTLMISIVLDLLPSIIVAKIIDFFTNYDGSGVERFYTLLGYLLVIGVVGTFLRVGSKHYLNRFTTEVQRFARVKSFEKLMEGDLIWHDKENTGNKMQRIGNGANSIGRLMDFYSNRGLSMVITFIGIIIVFSYFSFKFALLALIFMATYLTAELLYNRKISKKTLEVQIAKEQAAGRSYEFSSNISTVKSLGLEKSLKKEYDGYENTLLRTILERRNISSYKWITIQAISSIFYVLFIYFVGKDIILGIMSIGVIVIYVDYVRRIQGILNDISGQADRLIDAKHGIYRLMEIFKTIPDINEEGASDLYDWTMIKFKDVNFGYKEEDVMKNFNLDIKRGEKIGIVGMSGSGKSTLFKLLLKLYLPKQGNIYFDSKEINLIKRDSIVSKISIVPQETELFNLSFKDNILVASPKRINPRRYYKALEISQCRSIIEKLKEKDETMIGEKGVRLSGGERQRLGIARAIYRDSDIIIFDESTSNLDYATEKKIQKAIDERMSGKTMIIAAHRLSTLMNMNKILVMEKGKIVEQGTFGELLGRKGKFYRLWKKQEK